MIYYVYYDSYGNPRQAVSADELRERYGNDPEAFRASLRGRAPTTEHMTAHVGTVSLSDEKELRKFMSDMDEANRGFFEGEGQSRPFNF